MLVNFSTEHKKMLAHCKQLLELNGGCVAIDEHKHSKLITALRTAGLYGRMVKDNWLKRQYRMMTCLIRSGCLRSFGINLAIDLLALQV